MSKTTLVYIAVLASAGWFAACDSSDGGGSSSELTSSDSGPSDDASSVADIATSDVPTDAIEDAGPAADTVAGDAQWVPPGDGGEENPSDLCSDQADQDAMAEYPNEALYKWMLVQVQGCFYGLGGTIENPAIPDDEFQACILDVVQEGLGVSSECATCFSDIGLCSKMFCTQPCGAVEISEGMNLQGCLDCQKEYYCSHTFDMCIGWSLTEDMTLPEN